MHVYVYVTGPHDILNHRQIALLSNDFFELTTMKKKVLIEIHRWTVDFLIPLTTMEQHCGNCCHTLLKKVFMFSSHMFFCVFGVLVCICFMCVCVGGEGGGGDAGVQGRVEHTSFPKIESTSIIFVFIQSKGWLIIINKTRDVTDNWKQRFKLKKMRPTYRMVVGWIACGCNWF